MCAVLCEEDTSQQAYTSITRQLKPQGSIDTNEAICKRTKGINGMYKRPGAF